MRMPAALTANRNSATTVETITARIAATSDDMGPITAALARLLACAGDRSDTAADYAADVLAGLFAPTATAPESWIADQFTAALLARLSTATAHRQGAHK